MLQKQSIAKDVRLLKYKYHIHLLILLVNFTFVSTSKFKTSNHIHPLLNVIFYNVISYNVKIFSVSERLP